MLESTRSNDKTSSAVSIIMVCLILIDVAKIIADTFDLPTLAVEIGGIIETVSVVIFTVEYILRLWVADLAYPERLPFSARLKYIRSLVVISDRVMIHTKTVKLGCSC